MLARDCSWDAHAARDSLVYTTLLSIVPLLALSFRAEGVRRLEPIHRC